MHRIAAVLLLLVVAITFASTVAFTDVANGERLARRWCASCHLVAADQSRGDTQAAPFSAIAKEPGIDAAKIALYLLLPHPAMPDMSLSRKEAADLAVYISRQK